MIRIETIEIYNVNSISHLNLNFQPGVNILCGTNGIGKTTILECISNFYRRSSPAIGKKVDADKCTLSLTVLINDQKENYSHDISTIDGETNSNELRIPSNKLIYHSISQRQNARVVPLRIHDDGRTFARSQYDAIKSWFFRSYFKKKQMTEDKSNNFILTKEIFSKLDPNVYFVAANEKSVMNRFRDGESKVVEILLNTQYGIIDIDFLSSGYKACFNILFGIVRSIQERFDMSVENFDGVVLIDEIDLHLHPEWQTKIIDILKWLIPNAQIIITTHSPHVIQNAARGEIIPLGIDENKRMFVRDLPESNEYGYQGWTIEEILIHVMGLSDPRSPIFREKLKDFERALDEENVEVIKESYKALCSMLHPQNSLATLLRIQAREFLEEDEEEYE